MTYAQNGLNVIFVMQCKNIITVTTNIFLWINVISYLIMTLKNWIIFRGSWVGPRMLSKTCELISSESYCL